MEIFILIVKWVTVVTLIFGGFIGTFLPILPGSLFILLGAVAHYFLFGQSESGLTWVSFVILTVLFAASILVDWVSGAIGAKWFGASKWGIGGAILGGIIGIFFGFIGLVIGPLLGAFLFEMIFAKKELNSATKSTWGTLLGGGAGLIAKLGVSVLMIVYYITDAFFVN
ncbi:MAG: DUF456 domain-containing protein [Verrucomicrobiales bacterium]|nr:DUF456 domain-containing protein [Verrucomicrobiales bacterium]